MLIDNQKSRLTMRIRSRVLCSIGLFLLLFSQSITALIPVLMFLPETVAAADTTAPLLPTITHDPVGGSFSMNANLRLSVQAQVADNGLLSYQWEKKSSDESDYVNIPDATEAILDTVTDSGGMSESDINVAKETYYYRCKVYNTLNGQTTAAKTSKSATVVVYNKVLPTNLVNGDMEHFVVPDGTHKNIVGSSEIFKGYPVTDSDGQIEATEKTFGNTDDTNSNSGGYPLLGVLPSTYNDPNRSTKANGWYSTDSFCSHLLQNGWPGYEFGIEGQRVEGANYKQTTKERNGNNIIELGKQQPATVYQEVATEAGRIYEWSLEHGGKNKSALGTQAIAVIIGEAINEEEDYLGETIDTINFGWDSFPLKEEVTSPWTHIGPIWNHTYDQFRRYGKTLEAEGTYREALFQPNGAGTYFDDIIWALAKKYSYFSDDRDADIEAFGNAQAEGAYHVTYNSRTYYIYLSKQLKNTMATKTGSYSIPEGQGNTVFGFSYVLPRKSGEGNGLDNVVFEASKMEKAVPKVNYFGEKSITLQATPGYAYAITEIRNSHVENLASSILAQTTFKGGAITPKAANISDIDDPSYDNLGDGNWFHPNEAGSLVFNGLDSGKTYRIVSVPVGVISKELGTNISPTSVLDDNNYSDVTMLPGSLETDVEIGTLTHGVKINAEGFATGWLNLDRTNTSTQYALLKWNEVNGEYEVVKDWYTGDATGKIEWHSLALSTTKMENDYLVVSRPLNYSEIDYHAAETGGLAVTLNNPLETSEASNVANLAWEIKVDQVTRTDNGTSDLLTIKLDKPLTATDAGDGKIVIADLVTGQILGTATVDGTDNTKYTFTLSGANQALDVGIYLSVYQSMTKEVEAYAAPSETLGIDHLTEQAVLAGGSNIPTTVDYQLSNLAYTQGNGTTGALLTNVLDIKSPTSDELKVNYTKHFDHTKAVGVVKVISFDSRPAGPTVDTNVNSDIYIDYRGEQVKNNLATEVGVYGMSAIGASDATDNGNLRSFAALGWTGDVVLEVKFRTPATVNTFASYYTPVTIEKRPAAPTVGGVTEEGDTLKLTGVYPADTVCESLINGAVDDWRDVSVTAGGTATLLNYATNAYYLFRIKATDTEPSSQVATVQAGVVTITDITLTKIYGEEAVSGDVTIAINNTSTSVVKFGSDAFSFAGGDSSSFEIDSPPTSNEEIVASGENKTYKIKVKSPKNLNVNASPYTDTLSFTYTIGDNSTEYTAHANISLTVKKAIWDAPMLPAKSVVEAGTDGNSVTANSLTLVSTGKPDGAKLEYMIGEENQSEGWNIIEGDTISITDRQAATQHVVQLGYMADANHATSKLARVVYYTRFATPTKADLGINYTAETYNLSTANGGYTITLGNQAATTQSTGSLSALLDSENNNVKLVKNASGGASAESIPASAAFETNLIRGEAPTVSANLATVFLLTPDGKITESGGSQPLQYRLSTVSVWKQSASNVITGLLTGYYEVRRAADEVGNTFASKSTLSVEVFATAFRVEVDVGNVGSDTISFSSSDWTQSGNKYTHDFAVADGLTKANITPSRALYYMKQIIHKGVAVTADQQIAAGTDYSGLESNADDDGIVRYVIDWIHIPTYVVTIPTTIAVNHADEETPSNITVSTFYMEENASKLHISTGNQLTVAQAGDTLTIDTLQLFNDRGSGNLGANQFDVVENLDGFTQGMTIKRAEEEPKYAGIYTGTLDFTFEVVAADAG
ncbi:MAG: hypothetical protein LBS33_04030 [Streptococcaceae bacterium]|jgi:hypothetical protein|nr:hypothetical protein [Streptococcaceae bacterium]